MAEIFITVGKLFWNREYRILWLPLLRRNDDLSRNVASDVSVGADLLGSPSVREKSGRDSPCQTEGSARGTRSDGVRDLCVLLYFALDENGESDSEHGFDCDELFCGKHDALQKSVFFACLRGKRRDLDCSLGFGFFTGCFLSVRGRVLCGFSDE